MEYLVSEKEVKSALDIIAQIMELVKSLLSNPVGMYYSDYLYEVLEFFEEMREEIKEYLTEEVLGGV